MIRLTLNAQSDPEIHLFNKSTILIGADSAHVDLTLSGSHIQPIHLKIIEQSGLIVIINYANDPFVSINEHPFGKRALNSGDVISVDQVTILFELLDSSQGQEKEESAEVPYSLTSLLETKIQKQVELVHQECSSLAEHSPLSTTFSLPFEQEIPALKDEEWQNIPLEAYLKEFNLAKEFKKQSLLEEDSTLSEPAAIEQRKSSMSLKDDYLRDLNDENQDKENGPFSHLTEPSHLYQAWKWILLFIFSLLAISGAVGTIIYFSVSDKAGAQENKVTQAVADIAMALIHAQLTQLKPHNQNWTDADFLKSNLQAILPDTSSYALQIDAQGQFNCCPYNLRIYTSSDLSHFLLIAQPAPSLLHWLIPKSIIVVDSHLMELRLLKDVRGLNRLLANTDPLDGINGKEITALIKQGGLIRLSTLASESAHMDFAPPKNLAWMRPGAENLIYNSPRYYRLGQSLIQKAINLSTSKGSSQEVAELKQAVENFAGLNHLILYSEQGKKSALLTRQGMMMFAPTDKILFGYLLFNAQGKIHQVQLLKEDEEWKENWLNMPNANKDHEMIAFQSSSEIIHKEERAKHKHEEQALAIDLNHPIYIQLQALTTARENELKPLISALSILVNQELQTPRAQFQVEFQNLSHSYLMANAKHKQLLKETLDTLYHQYEDMPLNQFLAFVKGLNLEQLIQQDDQSLILIDENCVQNLESMLTHIEKSKNLLELDNFVHIASTWLNFDYIKDSHELMKYQNLLRNQLLAQLEKHLLSQNKHLTVKLEDREILQHILSQERLIKLEEREFFLEEFEELLASQFPESEKASYEN